MANDLLVRVEELHIWFELRRWGFVPVGAVRAVDGVSFQLRRGEAVAVVGESGCGKSTLARTLLGLHRPTRGIIEFAGRRVDPADKQGMRWYRSRVGYVQQDPYGALPPFMSVRQILREPLIIHGVRDVREQEERIRRVLEEVGLTPVHRMMGLFPHMLSGGQQQRLVIARATILQPELLVADEPVSMLDASVRVEILQLLRRLQDEHRLTMLYITHDLSTVRHFCERVFVMYGGRIVEQAPVDELLDAPRHPYTQALLQAIPDPDPANARRMREVPAGEPPSLLHPPAGCRFHPRCPAAMRGLCDAEQPPDFQAGREHRVACWLYAEEKASGAEEEGRERLAAR